MIELAEFFPRLVDAQQAAVTRAYLEGLWGWPAARVDGYLHADLAVDQVLAGRMDARRCVRGTSCGNACIAPGKTCRIKGNLQKLAKLKQLLALPAAGQSSSQGPGGARPANDPAGGEGSKAQAKTKPAKPETMAELKAGVLKAFGVTDERELKRNAHFKVLMRRDPMDAKGREFWAQLYRRHVAVPKSEQNLPDGPRVVNGIDVTKNFRPWTAFNLNPNKATDGDIKKAFLQLAKKHHPDAGGDPVTFDRLKKMRDTLLALRSMSD